MSDLAADIAPLSTTIDTDSGPAASGAGQPTTLAEPTLRDTIASAVKETEVPEAKPEAPQEVKEKPELPNKATEKQTPKEPVAEGKEDAPAKAPEATGQEAKDDRPSEGRKYPEPPARFQTDAKAKWTNTPYAVQQEVERMARDHETETTRYRESHDRYESVRHYDEAARRNGGDLSQSLARVVAIEDAMRANPIAGLQMVVQQAGLRHSLFDIAQHIVNQGPQALQQLGQQQQVQQSQSEVQQLRDKIAQMEQRQQGDSIASQVIAPFASQNPRYHELQDDIALFLQSGRIDPSLSPAAKLAEAYSMAERLNPPSHASSTETLDPEPESRAVVNFSGTKSIKSAPGAISEDMDDDSGDISTRDLLQRIVSKQLRRA